MHLRTLLPLASLLLALALGAFAQTPPEAGDRQILQADDARVQAMIRNDARAVADSLSDQLLYGHSDGRLQTKAELLAALASNRVQYRSVHYRERRVRTLGDNRAVTGVATFQLAANGVPMEFTLRFLAVYVFEDGRWRLGAYQSTQMPR